MTSLWPPVSPIALTINDIVQHFKQPRPGTEESKSMRKFTDDDKYRLQDMIQAVGQVSSTSAQSAIESAFWAALLPWIQQCEPSAMLLFQQAETGGFLTHSDTRAAAKQAMKAWYPEPWPWKKSGMTGSARIKLAPGKFVSLLRRSYTPPSSLSPSQFHDLRKMCKAAAKLHGAQTEATKSHFESLRGLIQRTRAAMTDKRSTDGYRIALEYLGLKVTGTESENIKEALMDARLKLANARRDRARRDNVDYSSTGRGRVRDNGGDRSGKFMAPGAARLEHSEAGYFLKQYKIKKRRNVQDCKKPIDRDRYLGIEIECYTRLTLEALIDSFVEAGLDKYVSIGTDGSITPPSGTIGCEIRVLTTEGKYYEVVGNVCKVLKMAGAAVNTSCGLHVHIDVRGRKPSIVYNNLVSMLPLLKSMVPKNRRDNRYCKENLSTNLTEEGTDRYKMINPAAVQEHSTIEVRLHSGSVNAPKIAYWIQVLVSLADAARIEKAPGTIEEAAALFGWPNATTDYIRERVEKFAGKRSKLLKTKTTTPVEEPIPPGSVMIPEPPEEELSAPTTGSTTTMTAQVTT